MLSVYSDLIQQFPTSALLFAWLRSPEGGRLIVRDETTSIANPYALIHYHKGTSDLALPHVGAFRSVIWDVVANTPACVSPSRGLKFRSIDLETDLTGSVAEDFVDGVMINMFHDGSEWRIATRTVLDAECTFYGKRFFHDLFWETFKSQGLSVETDLIVGEIYSWVLQHPEERVVVAPLYGIPRLYLVETTCLESAQTPKMIVARPARHAIVSLQEFNDKVEAMGKLCGTNWQGLVLKLADGRRYKLRSEEYNNAHDLRGNQSKRAYIWLERWSEGKLTSYLKIFPEEQHDAEAIVEQYKQATKELHEYYTKVYRNRELPLGQAPAKYRKLLWDAHKAGKGAYFPNLRQFMNEQDTARKLWLVNFDTHYPAAAAVSEDL